MSDIELEMNMTTLEIVTYLIIYVSKTNSHFPPSPERAIRIMISWCLVSCYGEWLCGLLYGDIFQFRASLTRVTRWAVTEDLGLLHFYYKPPPAYKCLNFLVLFDVYSSGSMLCLEGLTYFVFLVKLLNNFIHLYLILKASSHAASHPWYGGLVAHLSAVSNTDPGSSASDKLIS